MKVRFYEVFFYGKLSVVEKNFGKKKNVFVN